jgi:hypothetical protein
VFLVTFISMRISSRLLAGVVLLAGCGSVMTTPDGGGGKGGSSGGKGGANAGGSGGASTGGSTAGTSAGGTSAAGSGGTSAGGRGGAPTGTAGTGGAGGTPTGTAGTGGGAGVNTGGAGGLSTGGRGGAGGGPDNRGGQGGTDATSRGGAGGGALGVGGLGGAVSGCLPACDAMHTCVGTTCLLNQGLSCTLASQCASGACTAFYQDLDGDGYGTGAAMGFCGTTAPIGYAAANGDCCDDAAHVAVAKLIHPNAAYQMTSAGGVCNITWDYDCSGKIEKSAPMYACDPASAPPNCRTVANEYADSTCGMSVAGCGCGTSTTGTSCSLFCQGTTQTCK